MHVDDRALRAYLDDEDTAAVHATVAAHVAGCADCRAALEALSARAAEVSAHLAVLGPVAREVPAAPQVLARVRSRVQSVKGEDKPRMFTILFSKRLRPVWAGLLVLALLVAAFTIEPVRAWAGQFLGLFRAQQVAVVSLDTTRLEQLGGANSPLAQQMAQLLSNSLKITREPGKPQVVADGAAASQAAGFAVRLPASRADAPQLTVQDGAAFEVLVDRARAQAILDEAGRSDLQLPAAIDGATIKVDIPAGVSAAYGTCPAPSESDANLMMGGSASADTGSTRVYTAQGGAPGRAYADCVIFAQIPSPTVDTPPDVDLQQLAEIALEFTGMSPEQARGFASTVDWTSTLVVPIPRNGAVYEPVTVDGASGYLIQRPVDDAPQYALIWVKNGIVYAIGGLGTDTNTALQMANSLK